MNDGRGQIKAGDNTATILQTGGWPIVILGIVSGIVLLLTPLFAYSQVMESSNYRIRSDSINFGGVRGTSLSYTIEDTLGEIATGLSSSTSYSLRAGYQQMQEVGIAITSPSDVTMPNVSASNTSNGEATWTVTTDSPAGYTLSVSASTDPAMISGANSILDYTPAGADPDYDFSVASSDAEFGYSPEGADVATRFLDDGALCNSGAGETTDQCWDGFSTLNVSVATGSSANHTSGTATTIKFRAEIGSGSSQAAGTYTATITVTAVTL